MSTPTDEGAMTFRQLCQRTASEAGVASASTVPTPTTVAGQTGELLRVVNKVADAWREIQGRRLWAWMWESSTLTIPAGLSSLATNVEPYRWVKTNTWVPPSTPTSDGGRYLDYMSWQTFQRMYPRILAGSSIGVWTVAPDNSFRVNGIAPAGGLAINFERYARPTALRLDEDVPGMPADFHMLIVYKALRKIAGFDEAGTQRAVALDEELDLWKSLMRSQLPEMELGGSLLDD